MDRVASLSASGPRRSADSGGGGTRRQRSISAPQREGFNPPPRALAQISSPVQHEDSASVPEAGVRRAQTFASPDPMNPNGIRRRGTTSSSRPRGNTIARRATGLSVAPSMAPSGNYTLAGPQSPVVVTQQHQPYVDPGYTELNPAYEQPASSRPVWSLAKPIPRVVRPGMVPTASEMNVSQPAAPPLINEVDVERGPEPTLRLNRVSSKLKEVSAEREKRFFEKHAAPARTSSTSSRHSAHHSDTFAAPVPEGPETLPDVAEEDEPDHGDDLGDMPLGFDGRSDNMHSMHPMHPLHPFRAPTRSDYDFDDAMSAKTALDTIPEDEVAPLRAYNGLEDEIHNVHTHWSVVRLRFREFLAEFLAVVVQLTIGFSADLSYTVGKATNGDITNFAWGFATMVAIYIAGGISGAHLNPSVTLVFYVYRGFPKRKIPEYILAQLLGAFVAAFIAYGLYKTQIDAYIAAGGDVQSIVNSFVTNLRDTHVTVATGFFNEFVATAFLAIIIMALGDDANAPPGAGMNALILGFIIVVLSQAFAYNTGAALNPTRDFGPRLSLLALGFGGSHLFGDGWWIYGPIAGPIAGALVGAALYDICIFTGGESPINYPRKRMWRAGHKAKKRWIERFSKPKAEDEEIDDFSSQFSHDQ